MNVSRDCPARALHNLFIYRRKIMSFFTQSENYIEYHNAGETLRIMAWGANSLRVVSVPSGPLDLSSSALKEQEPSHTQIQADEETATITNGKISALIDTRGWNSAAVVTFFNDKKEILLKEIDGGALIRRARKFSPYIGGDYRLKVSFEANKDEKIYGMGQYQQDILDLKGCNIELAHRNSQASIPFYVSSKGYGFFWHNPAIGSVSFGKNVTEWRADSTKKMDYWITAGDTPAQIESQYSQVTGRAPMMPECGLGFWQCKLRYHNQEQVLSVAREYHRRGIPVDVFVVDYYHWPRCGDYRFDEHFFPDPKAMAEELRSYGMELMVSVWPQIDWRSENFKEMRQKGLLVQTEHGLNVQMDFQGNNVFYDATNPEAREYVWEKCRKNYRENGIKLFWLDEAEPEYTVYDFENYRYHLGPNVQIGNVYPVMYAQTFFEGMKKEGQENIVNLLRCAWAGSQRYGALVWSGDIHSSFESLQNQFAAGLNMGIAGIPWWTTDIGGFFGANIYDEDFHEVLIRWFEYGTFCPVMRLHGYRMPYQPQYGTTGGAECVSGAPNEIWSYGDKVYEICKKYIEMREAMRPYVRRLMEEAHEKGTPVMRPLFYDFPEDKTCWENETQYMFGPEILVAPVMEKGQEEREVYLPAGAEWKNVWTGECFKGGQTVTAAAPIEQIPLFTKNEFELNF